jgi:hypothetical protein
MKIFVREKKRYCLLRYKSYQRLYFNWGRWIDSSKKTLYETVLLRKRWVASKPYFKCTRKETSVCIFYFQMNFVKQIWIFFLLFTILHRLLFTLNVFLSWCPVILNKMRSWKEFRKKQKRDKRRKKRNVKFCHFEKVTNRLTFITPIATHHRNFLNLLRFAHLIVVSFYLEEF